MIENRYNTVIPFVIFPPKSGLFIIFQLGEHDNGQQFEQLIFREITLFFIEVFRWKKKKFKSKNLIHPSIDDYLFLKTRGEHDNGQEKLRKNLFYRGNMTKVGIWQRVLR